MLSRPVAGMACKLRLTTRQYQAVALVARDDRQTIRLMHRDAGLSIDLTDMADAEAAEEYCLRLAAFLDLPTVMMARATLPAEAAADPRPSPRRNRSLRARRPRFLTRRKRGEPIEIRNLERREIIARS